MADFEWQRFPRPYLDPEPTGQMADGGPAPDPTQKLVLKCLDSRVDYGLEYLGSQALPVFTLRTDNFVIAFTQVRTYVHVCVLDTCAVYVAYPILVNNLHWHARH